jgi:hypothetical protein
MKFNIVIVGCIFFCSLLSNNLSTTAAVCFLLGASWATFVACLDLSQVKADLAYARHRRQAKNRRSGNRRSIRR